MISEKQKKIFFSLILIFIFSAFFCQNLSSDLSLIFKKDLYAHDESSNSVITSNITRKFFPPMVRVNPLIAEQGNWMEGPFWQHIPPMFAYVPYIGYILDGKISIEVKRLSFAMLEWLTGVIFIMSVFVYSKSWLAGLASLLSSYLWLKTPFTRELVTGMAFGVSDILLAFTVTCAFTAILWYLSREKEFRINYSNNQLFVLILILTLPIFTKNLLGLIPITTFFIILFYDHRKWDKKIIYSIISFIVYLLVYFVLLFLSSPITFANEFLVSFNHFNNYEGWGRPFAFYITDYLPKRYLGNFTNVFYFVLAFSLLLLPSRKSHKVIYNLLSISSLWFMWNIIAVSFITSKVPNFIFQTYLLGIFFVVYSAFLIIQFYGQSVWEKFITKIQFRNWSEKFIISLLITSLLFSTTAFTYFVKNLKTQRALAYTYQTEHEKFYQLGEYLQAKNVSVKDITIINYPQDDCWLRYYILFLTGAESKTLLEMYFYPETNRLKSNYQELYFITESDQSLPNGVIKPSQTETFNNFVIYSFNLSDVSETEVSTLFKTIFEQNKQFFKSEIVQIKKDKSSCQWLVPDSILNTP